MTNEFINYNELTTFLSQEGSELLDEFKFIKQHGHSSGIYTRQQLKQIFDFALDTVNKNNNINYLCEVIMTLREQILKTIVDENNK